MFTGIIEEVGEVLLVAEQGSSRSLRIRANMTPELKVDQSVAHNGVCLTVVRIEGGAYDVTVVDESLQRSNLGTLAIGSEVNLERSLRIGDRLDGHMVQGHVDTTVQCLSINDLDGSWSFVFELPEQKHLLVTKGSICINGVSLTIAVLDEWSFGVAVIPYTYEHTSFRNLETGDRVNVEFDILGKYVDRMLVRSSP